MSEKLELPDGYVVVCVHCAKEIGITLDSQSGNNAEDVSNMNKTLPKGKELSDEEIYNLWCDADNTECMPEMRNKDGSINQIITTFAELIIKASRGEE